MDCVISSNKGETLLKETFVKFKGLSSMNVSVNCKLQELLPQKIITSYY